MYTCSLCCTVTFTEKQLVGVLLDLFAGGSETVTTTLIWSIIFMVLNPSVQARVYAEIVTVIDEQTSPRIYHRRELPYTEACICEIQRLGDVLPLSVSSSTTEDVYIKGYCIPKDTMIITSLYSVHMDPNVWSEPRKYRPERFLDNQGRVKLGKELMLFGAGVQHIHYHVNLPHQYFQIQQNKNITES